MIRMRGVRFAYRGGPPILKGCDLQLGGGQVVALAGPNGSGKTTLLRLAAGLLRPDGGEVLLDGRPVSGWGRVARAKRLAYVPQNPSLPEDWPVEAVLELGDYPHREEPPASRPLGERMGAALKAMDLDAFRGRPSGTLSGGEAQRVVLARALVQDVPLLVLDEPANHLDLGHQLALYRLLADLAAAGRSVLLSTHDLNLSRLFGQRLVLLNGDGVVKDLPEEPGRQRQVLQEVFGVPFIAQEVAGVLCWQPDVWEFRRDGDREPESQ